MKLSTREAGNPKGRPVVLLHAFPMSAAMWEPQLEALKEFRVIAPDLRGFGGTPIVAPWFIEHAVDDVLETAPQEPAVFVGLSMGGYVALRLAEKAPARVKALALCDTRAEADDNAAKVKRAGAMEVVRSKGVEGFIGPFLNDALSQKTLTEKLRVAETLKGIALKAPPVSVMNALSALAARPDMTGALAQIKVPTAVIVGSQDKITPLPLSEAMRNRIPGAELHLVPDSGHFSNMENPAVFNERLLSFLRRLT